MAAARQDWLADLQHSMGHYRPPHRNRRTGRASPRLHADASPAGTRDAEIIAWRGLPARAVSELAERAYSRLHPTGDDEGDLRIHGKADKPRVVSVFNGAAELPGRRLALRGRSDPGRCLRRSQGRRDPSRAMACPMRPWPDVGEARKQAGSRFVLARLSGAASLQAA